MKRAIYFFLMLICIQALKAEKYYFRHYQNDDGLSHNTVLSCIQDHQGFMWFGTKDGLNRFDGLRFKTFYSISSSNAISNSAIGCLCEDNRGKIWMATFHGLFYYDTHSDTFHSFTIRGKSFNEAVVDIKADTMNRLWFTTYSGLFLYNPEKRDLVFYPITDKFKPQFICLSRNGEIWISSLEGKIYKYLDQSGTFKSFQILTADEVKDAVTLNKIKEDDKGRIYICTNKAGIRILNQQNGLTRILFTRDRDDRQMSINDILICKNGNIWIGTDNALYRYDFQDGLSQPIYNSIDDPYSLSDKGIKALYEDREGGIWICTFYGGLNYLPHEVTPFEKFVPSLRPGHLQAKIIRPICGDNSGNVWIGSEDGGLFCYNQKDDSFTSYPLHCNIQTLIIDHDKLWIGTYDKGIFWMNLKTHNIIHKDFQGLKNDFVISILRTQNNTILIGTVSGLYRYNPLTEDVERVQKSKLECFVHCMKESSDGTLWLGTYGQGLYAYQRNNNSLRHYLYDANNPSSISSNIITSITEDSHQQIWLTTEGNGFCKLNRDQTFTRYLPSRRFPCEITCAMIEDAKGYLWITTTKGLICFNPHTSDYIIYKKSDGLTDNHFTYNSRYTDSNGKTYLGCINGMIAFNPYEMKTNRYMPDVFITGLTVMGTNKDFSGNGESVLTTKKISLPYNKSSFSVDYVAPSFTNPELAKYRYILEGYDRNWTYITDYREIYYTNVTPGHYKLRVAILDHNNNWNSHETSIDLVITPPFWKSISAYILYGILLITISAWIYKKNHAKRIQKQQRMIESLENRKEKELYNAKIQFFTNITHEVRTPLTLIKVPLDKILSSENLPDFMMKNLLIMKRNVDRLLDLINQLLDFRKTEMEMLRLSFVRTDICILVKNTVARFIPSIEDAQKKIQYHIPDEPHILAVDQEIIIKILSNLLSNALKYSKDFIEVYIETPIDNPELTYIRINSNGELIPDNLKERIFEPFYQIEENPLIHTKKGSGLGLSLSRTLAELHHGKLFCDSQITTMNSFVLALSNNQKENVKVTNTEPVIPQEIMKDENQTDDTRYTILIVDDEKEMVSFVADELSVNYNVLTAYNGNEAINILKEGPIHMVISDVLMPVMDGYALCNFIKSSSEYCHIPVILLTASVALNARIAGLKSGADGYIEKPFSIELLLGQINNIFKNKELACKNFINSPLSNYKSITVNKIDEDFMKQMHNIIVSHLSDSEFSVEELASSLNMSMSTLFRKVKAITDLGPHEYIRLYKLKKAAEMLAEGKYKVNEVAYIIGFSSSSYFSTSFQKQFNLSPTEFIKQQKIL